MMVKIPKLTYFLLVLIFAFGTVAYAENCTYAGTHAWSNQLLNLVPGCETRTTSPDGQKILRMNARGRLLLSLPEGKPFEPVGYKVEPPAMASWAPDSTAFFINDGEGSGMSSKFRLFKINARHVILDDSIGKTAVRLFRQNIGCPSSTANPNVYGFGWSSDGKQVFLLVQATVNDSCGEPGTFLSLIVNVGDGSIREQLTEKKTEQRFRSLLFPELFKK
jgi:hypothetical protein